MLRVRRAVALVAFALGALVSLLSGTARAQASRSQSIHVLSIDSDDADEQAEALTGALRSRVRAASGWILVDTAQSLSMLTAALRCPQRPDAPCLQRIGDQLKTDRFVWGLITRAPGHQVTADVHLWSRGKPDQSVKEIYSDNLKDQNDDVLRKIATRFFDRLAGSPTATVNVHVVAAAGSAALPGEATVGSDDNQKATTDHGGATLTLSPGPHVLTVSAPGYGPARQSVVANAGAAQDVTVELSAILLAPPPPTASKGKTAAVVTVVSGGALVVAGGIMGIAFEVERSKLATDRLNNYNTFSTRIIQDPCNPGVSPNLQTTAGCSAHNTAAVLLPTALVTVAVGAIVTGTGVWLLTRDQKEGPPTMGVLRDVRLSPAVGPREGSLTLSASF